MQQLRERNTYTPRDAPQVPGNCGSVLNREGFAPSIRRQRYSLQPHDWVKYLGQVMPIKGVHCLGKYVLLENNKSVSIAKVEFYKYKGGWQFLPLN